MADINVTTDANFTNNTTPAATDRLLLVDDGTTTLQDIALSVLAASAADVATGTEAVKWITPATLKGFVFSKGGTIGNPNSYYTSVRAQVPIFFTTAALTITRIIIKGADSTPTTELAGDLKHADDVFTGGFANAAVIDVCDTTNGSFDASTGFDDATVPANKWIYFQFDAAPHVDWKDAIIQFFYTYD